MTGTEPQNHYAVAPAADAIRAALRALDLRTDVEFWQPAARFHDLMDLHQRAVADLGDEHPTTKSLYWETVLSNTGHTPNRRAGSREPRFAGGRFPIEAVELLAHRCQAPSEVVRAEVGDLLLDQGGREQWRAAIGTPAAMLAVARSLDLVDDADEDASRTGVVEDTLERAAELALSLNQRELVRDIGAAALATLRAGVERRRPHRVRCSLPALNLLARRLAAAQRDEMIDLLRRAVAIFEAEQRTSLPYVVGQIYETWRIFELARGDHAAAADVDAAQAEAWIRHAETLAGPTAGLVAAHFLDGALFLLERAGGRSERINQVRLRRRELTSVGLHYEMRTTAIRIPLKPALVQALDRIAEQRLPALLASLALDPAFRVTTASCRELQERTEAVAPLAALFPTRVIRSEASSALLGGEAGEVARAARDLLKWTGGLLGAILRRVRSREDISPDGIVGQLQLSGNVPEENLELVAVGVERALAGDCVSALHVLVPQLEDVLRSLLPRVGVDTMVPGRDPSTTEEITLGRILSRLTEKGVMTEDDRFLFSLVLERAAGDNVRHDIAHGLIRLGACTDEQVARILLLYTIVASWTLPSPS